MWVDGILTVGQDQVPCRFLVNLPAEEGNQMIRILGCVLLVISVIGIMLVNEQHLIPYVGWLWLIISHGLVLLSVYAITLLLDRD